MAIFDILKKGAKGEKKQAVAAKEKKPEKIKEKIKTPEVLPGTPERKKKEKKHYLFSHKILKEPRVSEKGTRLAEINQYIFKVFKNSSKKEIKNAVESLYGVDVLKVRIVNIPSKKVRVGKSIGEKSGYKKAIISVKEGQKIEIAPR